MLSSVNRFLSMGKAQTGPPLNPLNIQKQGFHAMAPSVPTFAPYNCDIKFTNPNITNETNPSVLISHTVTQTIGHPELTPPCEIDAKPPAVHPTLGPENSSADLMQIGAQNSQEATAVEQKVPEERFPPQKPVVMCTNVRSKSRRNRRTRKKQRDGRKMPGKHCKNSDKEAKHSKQAEHEQTIKEEMEIEVNVVESSPEVELAYAEVSYHGFPKLSDFIQMDATDDADDAMTEQAKVEYYNRKNLINSYQNYQHCPENGETYHSHAVTNPQILYNDLNLSFNGDFSDTETDDESYADSEAFDSPFIISEQMQPTPLIEESVTCLSSAGVSLRPHEYHPKTFHAISHDALYDDNDSSSEEDICMDGEVIDAPIIIKEQMQPKPLIEESVSAPCQAGAMKPQKDDLKKSDLISLDNLHDDNDSSSEEETDDEDICVDGEVINAPLIIKEQIPSTPLVKVSQSTPCVAESMKAHKVSPKKQHVNPGSYLHDDSDSSSEWTDDEDIYTDGCVQTPLPLHEQICFEQPSIDEVDAVSCQKRPARCRQISVTESEDSFIVFGGDSEDEDCDFVSGSEEDDDDESDDESSTETAASEYEDADSKCTMRTSATPGKKVRFADDTVLCDVHPMVKWAYAYQAARKGPWEEYARDRERFKRRIAEASRALNLVFQPAHRKQVFVERFATPELSTEVPMEM